MLRLTGFLFLICSGLFLAFRHGDAPSAPGKPKNVILLIGDGMGLTQITAGMYSNHNRISLEQFPATGLITTHSARHLVTDSGAGATAFACGCKTNNYAIGVDQEKAPCRTLLEDASARGMATGLVASSSITHATPASFIAHVPDRNMMEEIAAFFLQTNIDLFIGGGMKYFNQRSKDQRNLVNELTSKGYNVQDFSKAALDTLRPAADKPFVWFSADEEPVSVLNGRFYLPVAAKLAPAFLKKRSDKGFFLMLEGSQIDWACHQNDGESAICEMLDFDRAITEIVQFAKADGETLVVVTADHETGGMSIVQNSVMDSLEIKYTSKGHTASLVPVFAFGPGAEAFNGVYDNTDIYRKIKSLMLGE